VSNKGLRRVGRGLVYAFEWLMFSGYGLKYKHSRERQSRNQKLTMRKGGVVPVISVISGGVRKVAQGGGKG